jgi:hypothetical protein
MPGGIPPAKAQVGSDYGNFAATAKALNVLAIRRGLATAHRRHHLWLRGKEVQPAGARGVEERQTTQCDMT